jgi:hypothetical protein
MSVFRFNFFRPLPCTKQKPVTIAAAIKSFTAEARRRAAEATRQYQNDVKFRFWHPDNAVPPSVHPAFSLALRKIKPPS